MGITGGMPRAHPILDFAGRYSPIVGGVEATCFRRHLRRALEEARAVRLRSDYPKIVIYSSN